jgi:pimeloyl-ACP methyl ester carboxylesterase
MGVLFGRPGATPESVRDTADKLRDQIQSANGVAWALGAQQNMSSMVKTEAMRSLAVDDAHRSDRGMAARALHELITTDLRPELKNITVPVRVLYVRSPATPLNEAQTDAVYRSGYANLRGATLTRVPDSYHFIMFDQPERFAAELKAFLGG